MVSHPAQCDDEWEYEYDQSDTEVFLVDLDLTTVNHTMRSTTENRNKRFIDLSDKSAVKKRQKTQPGLPGAAANAITQDDGTAVASVKQSVVHEGGVNDQNSPGNGIQILDLHTSNPIISHEGQVFSCAWTDMIGTTMFFGQPRDTSLYDPEISTNDFDMIGTSRIKLVGRETKVTPIPQNVRERGRDGSPERPGQSLGTIKRSNAKINADLRKQANFLEQLMNVKKNRGEADNVHIVMNNRIAKSLAEGKLKFNTQRRGEQIEELNRKVVRGDAEALRKLEQIYSGRDNEDSDDDEHVAGENGETPMRLRRRPAPRVPESDTEFEEDIPRIVGTASPSPEIPYPVPGGTSAPNAAPNNISNKNG